MLYEFHYMISQSEHGLDLVNDCIDNITVSLSASYPVGIPSFRLSMNFSEQHDSVKEYFSGSVSDQSCKEFISVEHLLAQFGGCSSKEGKSHLVN
jgi:hypothetical protein